jgi:hypothetical protein
VLEMFSGKLITDEGQHPFPNPELAMGAER